MLGKYFVYTHRWVYKRGIRDGRNWEWRLGWPVRKPKAPYPLDSQMEPAEFEKELYSVANSKLSEMAEKWAKEDEPLRQACIAAEGKYNDAKEAKGLLSVEEQKKIKKYETAQMRYNSLSPPALSALYFGLAVIFLALCEFVTNQMVFDIFLAPRWETILMALGTVACIAIVAKLQGYYLRRKNRNIMEVCFIVVAFIFAVSVLVGFSWLRGRFLEAMEIEQVLGISISPAGIMRFFFSINIIFYFVCLWLSYAATSEKPDEFKVAKQELKESKKEFRGASANARRAQKSLEEAHEQFDRAHVKRTRIFAGFQEATRGVVNRWAALVRPYRDGNVQARRSGGYGPPRYFELIKPETQITIPSSLREIDCTDCTYPSQVVAKPNDNSSGEETSPKSEGDNMFTSNNSTAAVPLLLTEMTDSSNAQALFQTFLERAGLEGAMKQVEHTTGVSRNQLCYCLEGQRNPRYKKKPADESRGEKKPWWNFVIRWRRQRKIAHLRRTWAKAWGKLAKQWHEVEQRLLSTPMASRYYHLYPNLVLPLAFAMGAVIGLRRPLAIYHSQADRYFQVLDMPNPREQLFPVPIETTVKPPEILQGHQGHPDCNKLILHLFISDQHEVDFKKHTQWQTANNKAIVYYQALPEEGWLGYLQYLVAETKKLYSQYKTVEICLICPAAIAFALGMAFAMDTNITVCHFDGQNYFPVLTVQELQKKKMFT